MFAMDGSRLPFWQTIAVSPWIVSPAANVPAVSTSKQTWPFGPVVAERTRQVSELLSKTREPRRSVERTCGWNIELSDGTLPENSGTFPTAIAVGTITQRPVDPE